MTRNEKIINNLKEQVELLKHPYMGRDGSNRQLEWLSRLNTLESELASIESEEEENNCDHEHTETKGIWCNVCADCGEVLETDI